MTRKKTTLSSTKKKIIWFNLPYGKNVTTKVGTFFLIWIVKHFPQHHNLHNLFNRNNVKISYSTLSNIKSMINAHNRKILYPSPTIGRRTCNCINIPQCLLQQKYLSNNSLNQANIAQIAENPETKIYYNICETIFNLSYANHKNRSATETVSQILSYLTNFGK